MALSLFRSDFVEWLDSAIPTTRTSRGLLQSYRQLYPVTRHTLRDIAEQFQRLVKERAAKHNIPILEAPKGRRDEFVDPYFKRAKPIKSWPFSRHENPHAS